MAGLRWVSTLDESDRVGSDFQMVRFNMDFFDSDWQQSVIDRAVNTSRFVISSFRFVANETKQIKNFVSFR
jgi:hypothetical protein